jgi:hypothetical protein
MLAGNPAYDPGAFVSIATTTVGSGGTANVEFTSIPSTYTHLQVRCFAQTNRATYGIDEANITFNSDTGSNYVRHLLYGDGSATSASADTSQTSMRTGSGNFGTTTGSNWGSAIIDILDYKNTNKYTTIRSLSGADCNGTVGGLGGRVGLFSGLWLNTNAVTSIKLVPANGTLFSQYSHFALYGIRTA